MKIIISEIPEDGLALDLNDDIRSDIVRIVSPVKATLRFDKVGPELIARGVLTGDVELQCARCLKDFQQRISSQINVAYHPAKEIGKAEHHELKGEELDIVFYSDDILDTDDLLRDQLALNLPMKPLCSPDCKGICPQCGADLTVSGCACETKKADSRFDVLKKLTKKKE